MSDLLALSRRTLLMGSGALGAVNDVRADAMACAYRDSNFIFEQKAMWRPLDPCNRFRFAQSIPLA